MQESLQPPLPPAPDGALPQKCGRPLLAWAVIAAIVALEVVLPYLRGDDEPSGRERAAAVLVESQGRILVGIHHLFPGQSSATVLPRDTFNTGPLGQRFRFVALVGEVSGPEAALRELHELDERVERCGVTPTAAEQSLRNILGRLYQDYTAGHLDAPSLTAEDRALLRTELGWTGELALAPQSGPDEAARHALLWPARRAALAILVFAVALLLLGLLGLVGLAVLVVFLATGILRSHFHAQPEHGALYVEAFAVWMALHLGLGLALGRLPAEVPRILLNIALFLLTAGLALAWPVLRGAPWARVRQDVGLTLGRRPWRELLAGLGGYVLCVPLLGIGAISVQLLLALEQWLRGVSPEDDFGPTHLPAHPITEVFVRPDAWVWLQVFILACVMAPLLEETLFRGMLFRHLREASRGAGRALSFLASALTVSFVFAVIHPQGVLGVPALTALAIGFALLREWRGSLVAAMMAHGINNAVVLLLNILVVGA